MARILVMTSGLVSLTLGALEVVRRLEEAGHEVTFASPHDVRELVESNGVRYRQLDPVAWDPAPQVEGGSRLVRKLKEIATRDARRREGVERLGMAAFGARLDVLKPDLVLIDLEMDEHVMTLLARRARVALLSCWFEHLKRNGLPPLGSSAIPGEGADGTPEAIAAAWREVRAAHRRKRGDVWLRYLGTDRRSVLASYARRQGLRGQLGHGEDWVTHFDYPGVPTLTTTPTELEFDHEWRPERRAVGPMVRLDRQEDGASVDELEAAVAAARAAGQRVLYASASTRDRRDVGFLVRIASAARALGDTALVVGMGGDSEGAARLREALPVETGARVLDRAPQIAALHHADAALNHGGIGSILEAAVLGVPMVVASAHGTDQDGCAARVRHHDAGVVLEREGMGDDDLRNGLRAALSEEHRAQRAAELAAQCARYREERALETAVEELLEAPPPVRSRR